MFFFLHRQVGTTIFKLIFIFQDEKIVSEDLNSQEKEDISDGGDLILNNIEEQQGKKEQKKQEDEDKKDEIMSDIQAKVNENILFPSQTKSQNFLLEKNVSCLLKTKMKNFFVKKNDRTISKWHEFFQKLRIVI